MGKVGIRGSNSRTLADRFWPKVSIPVLPQGEFLSDQCWEWTASVDTQGYGQLRVKTRAYGAHRVSYELANGPIPEGMDVCHHCDNPPCVRADHLFLGTAKTNARDMVEKGRNAWSAPPQPTAAQKARGERHGEAKLTESDVKEIRARHMDGESQYSLAAAFDVTRPNIGFIVRRKTWAHVS